MYRKGTYLAYNNNVTKDGPCKKILCLYTDKRYDYIVRLSSAYLCDQNNVISLRHELLQCYCTGRFDLLKSAEMCSRYVKEVGIDSVLALEDVAAPILSSLVEKYGSFAFRGPSFESVFLTINKYYTRKLLDPNPVPYCHIDLNSHLESATLENLFGLNSKSSSNSYSMYRKGTYLAYNNNVTKDGPCKKILCLYTDKRYDYIVRLSSAYLCDQNNVISLRHELLQCYCTGRFDLLKSAEMCSRYVKEVGIDSVLALEDVAAPILSSLVEKYGSFAFRGPSFESVFLTINKYYTRKLLDPNPVPYCHIDLNSHLESATLENMLNEVGLPAILKPACGTGSVLIQKINSFDDLLYAIESSKKHYSSVIGSHAPLSSKFLDLSRYPLALTDRLMILEKYVDGEIIELDGYVFNGKAYRWALYDLTTWPTHPNVNQMLFLPSTKPTHIQDRIWDMFETVANRAADYGYDNHFMNMQLFLCKNGDVRLLEINGRMTTVCSPLCQKSLTSGDTIEAQLRLAQGDKPPPAKFTGVHSAYVSIRSTISGKADEIIDFQVAESMENVNLHTGPDDYIQPVGDGGKSVGGAYLFADSREEIWQKHRDLYKRLFKKHPIGLSN